MVGTTMSAICTDIVVDLEQVASSRGLNNINDLATKVMKNTHGNFDVDKFFTGVEIEKLKARFKSKLTSKLTAKRR